MLNKLKIGLILLVVICVFLIGVQRVFLTDQEPNNQQEEIGVANLTYTLSYCEGSEPEKEIIETHNNEIFFDVDFTATNCKYKAQMEKNENLIKLLFQGEDCCWSIGCYNIKGKVEPLEKDKYILEFQEIVRGKANKIIKKEVTLN